MYNVYQVKYNDTLDSIAKNFGITKDELISINNIGDISYGSFIVVPSNVSKFLNYTVEKGDTLYSIATRFNTTVDSLVSLNGLNKDDYIYPGEAIIVPRNGIGTYVTKEGDTLTNIISRSSLEDIINMNSKIYLLPNQLIVYTKE